jgi:hypothetical protein
MQVKNKPRDEGSEHAFILAQWSVQLPIGLLPIISSSTGASALQVRKRQEAREKIYLYQQHRLLICFPEACQISDIQYPLERPPS